MIDLSESNHEDFRETVGTPASPARIAGIGVNPVLHNFPDERRMLCMAFAEPDARKIRLASGNLLLRNFDQSAVEIRVASRRVAP